MNSPASISSTTIVLLALGVLGHVLLDVGNLEVLERGACPAHARLAGHDLLVDLRRERSGDQVVSVADVAPRPLHQLAQRLAPRPSRAASRRARRRRRRSLPRILDTVTPLASGHWCAGGRLCGELERPLVARTQLAHIVADADPDRPADALALHRDASARPPASVTRSGVPRNCIGNDRPSSRSVSRGLK